MSKQGLAIGVIGCGRIAQAVHLPVLSRLPDVRVVALAESNPAALERARCRAPHAHPYQEYRELLANEEVEAVVICLPTGLHAEATLAALAHRKALYLEKPIAASEEQAASVLSAWRSAGTTAMVGFNYRFHPVYREARRRLQAGDLGQLAGARLVFSSAVPAPPAWKTQRESGGGVLLDLASHHADLVPFLFGSAIRSVSGTWRSQRTECDTAFLQLTLEDGLTVQSLVSLRSVNDDRLEVYGETGRLVADRHSHLDVEVSGTGEMPVWRRCWSRLRPLLAGRDLPRKLRFPGYDPSFAAALAHFVACARSGKPAQPDLEDGWRSLAVVLAAERSASRGGPVPVEYGDAHPARQ